MFLLEDDVVDGKEEAGRGAQHIVHFHVLHPLIQYSKQPA